MTWFKVDDSFHSHPKVMATDPAALGLWVVAGTWSSANQTDGFVPDHVISRLLPDSAKLARKLVTAGLWTRTRRGYQFHDWDHYNPTREELEVDREAARERMRELRRQRKRSPELPRTKGERSGEVRDPRPGPSRTSFRSSTTPNPAEDGGAPPVDNACDYHADTLGKPHGNCRACGTNPRQANRRAKLAAVPTWCGHCDERTRLVDDGDACHRCHRCHPLVSEDTA